LVHDVSELGISGARFSEGSLQVWEDLAMEMGAVSVQRGGVWDVSMGASFRNKQDASDFLSLALLDKSIVSDSGRKPFRAGAVWSVSLVRKVSASESRGEEHYASRAAMSRAVKEAKGTRLIIEIDAHSDGLPRMIAADPDFMPEERVIEMLESQHGTQVNGLFDHPSQPEGVWDVEWVLHQDFSESKSFT